MSNSLLAAIGAGASLYDLAQQYRVGMPQSPNHPKFSHSLPRRHGDMVRKDGGSAANDLIVTGTHVGTHIDALAHVSQGGRLFGGVDAQESCIGGRYESLGVHTIPPMLSRGVLIDVAGHKGVDCLDGGYEITLADVTETLEAQASELRPDDIVLVRSGWGSRFGDHAGYMGTTTGVPGIGVEVAEWLAVHKVRAVGADSTALEVIRAGAGHAELPVHRVFLVEHGIYIIETMNLEELAASKNFEFALVLIPLNIFGATGSPVRPVALVDKK